MKYLLYTKQNWGIKRQIYHFTYEKTQTMILSDLLMVIQPVSDKTRLGLAATLVGLPRAYISPQWVIPVSCFWFVFSFSFFPISRLVTSYSKAVGNDEGAWAKLRAKYRLSVTPLLPPQGGICVILLKHSWLPENKGKGFKCLPC